MSLLTPERVPVKVYRWDDVGAPALDKTAGCMMTIFKACLVTGYGTKQGAGWTIPFEDTSAGVKVFRPEISPHTDFYLRCSADTGTEVAAQAYLNMTNASTGDLKLQCATPFKYAKANSTGKWLLIASTRGFWFFCEQRISAGAEFGVANNTGAFFVIGDTSSNINGQRAVYLHHSGGTNSDGSYASPIGYRGTGSQGVFISVSSVTVAPKIMLYDETVLTINSADKWFFDGFNKRTTELHTTQIPVFASNDMYILPGVFLPSNGPQHTNFEVLNINQSSDERQAIVFGASGQGPNNIYIATDYWSY